MPVYAVGITPLLPVHTNPSLNDGTKQIAFADDLLGAGKLRSLRDWWSEVLVKGPRLGYHPNANKTWLVVKPEVYEQANVIFSDTSINITREGRKYLGGFIGTNTSRDVYARTLAWMELSVKKPLRSCQNWTSSCLQRILHRFPPQIDIPHESSSQPPRTHRNFGCNTATISSYLLSLEDTFARKKKGIFSSCLSIREGCRFRF